MKQKNFLLSFLFVIPAILGAFKFVVISDAKYVGHENPMIWYFAATIISSVLCLLFAKRSNQNEETSFAGSLLAAFSIIMLIFFPLFAFVVVTAGSISG